MAAVFLLVVRARRFAVAVVANHACLPSSVSVIVTKLTVFRVQTAARINEWVPTLFERGDVFATVEAVPPVFSEGSGAGGGRETAAAKRRVVDLQRGANRENLCKVMLLLWSAVGCEVKPRVNGIIDGHNNGITARSRLP